MREAALTYADRLQDFICTQITTRSADKSGTGKHWKLLEVQEVELSYVAHKENYVLLKVNGRSENIDKGIQPGYFRPGGEFGTALKSIFDSKADAEFNWDHEEPDGGQRLCVFRYRVPQATSMRGLQVDSDKVVFAYHGFVYANCESGAVMRIQIETEPAAVTRKGRRLAVGTQLDLRYRPTAIGTKEFLLPQSAEEVSRFGQTLTRAEIQFQKYQKFQADSKIIFDQEGQKPKTIPEPQR